MAKSDGGGIFGQKTAVFTVTAKIFKCVLDLSKLIWYLKKDNLIFS